jgi:hypothetical protein
MTRYIYDICEERYKFFLNSDETISIVVTKTYEILLSLIGNKNDEEFSLFFNIHIINFTYINGAKIISFENIDDFLDKIRNTYDYDYDFFNKLNIFLIMIKSSTDMKEKYNSNKRTRYN